MQIPSKLTMPEASGLVNRLFILFRLAYVQGQKPLLFQAFRAFGVFAYPVCSIHLAFYRRIAWQSRPPRLYSLIRIRLPQLSVGAAPVF